MMSEAGHRIEPGTAHQAHDASDAQPSRIRPRIVVAVTFGNAMEWYDFALTAFLAAQLARNFFPSSTPLSGLLNVFLVFGVAFVARPLGGLILGPLADRRGRMLALLLTLGIMAVATFLIGVLPSERTLGIAAPILLVALRVIQGFSAGAEFGTSLTYIVEHAPAKHKGFVTSFIQSSSVAGFLLASAIVSAVNAWVPPASMQSWGWRVPFLLALPFGLIGLYIRQRLEETPEFRTLVKTGQVQRSPLLAALRENWRAVTRIAGMSAVMNVGYYTAFAYFPGHMARLGYSPSQISVASTITLLTGVLTIPLFGLLSDLKGRRVVLIGASVALLVLPMPLFSMMGGLGLGGVIACEVAIALGVAAYNSTVGVANAEGLNPAARSSTIAVGINIGTVLFAAPTLYVMTLLNTRFAVSWAPAMYLSFAAALSLIAAATLPATFPTGAVTRQNSPA